MKYKRKKNNILKILLKNSISIYQKRRRKRIKSNRAILRIVRQFFEGFGMINKLIVRF